VAGEYRVTARVGPKVEKERFASLDDALEALAARIGGVDRVAGRRVLGREYEAVRQVAGRFELRGPGMRGGVDVRGDGSAEAWTGRLRRRLVEARGSEDAYAALRRVLGTQSTSVEP
jgi:hypothetical protein